MRRLYSVKWWYWTN